MAAKSKEGVPIRVIDHVFIGNRDAAKVKAARRP